MTQVHVHPSWYKPRPEARPPRPRYGPRPPHVIALRVARAERRCWDCGRGGEDVWGVCPRCEEHRRQANLRRMQRYRERRAAGVCPECGRPRDVPGPLDPQDTSLRRLLCQHCRRRHQRSEARRG